MKKDPVKWLIKAQFNARNAFEAMAILKCLKAIIHEQQKEFKKFIKKHGTT